MQLAFAANGGKVPRYLCHYPYSPLIVAKVYLTICIAVCLVMWNELKPWLRTSYLFTGMAVLDLLSLLFTLISLWFALQKFFWVKLESALTIFSLVFICLAAYCVHNIQTKLNHVELSYLTACHGYMVLVQVFTIGWTLKFTKNNVSNLFISNWGAEVNYGELQQLDNDF
uniref:Uncharacterized protein n=1 Tax=Ditylenchus dipsaci TaxID=166011 RepID=A0A915DCQ5_9BILA